MKPKLSKGTNEIINKQRFRQYSVEPLYREEQSTVAGTENWFQSDMSQLYQKTRTKKPTCDQPIYKRYKQVLKQKDMMMAQLTERCKEQRLVNDPKPSFKPDIKASQKNFNKFYGRVSRDAPDFGESSIHDNEKSFSDFLFGI